MERLEGDLGPQQLIRACSGEVLDYAHQESRFLIAGSEEPNNRMIAFGDCTGGSKAESDGRERN
jgi:hypothetical protein